MEKYKKELISIISKYLPESTIYLYGSRARGTQLSGADIDLGIDNKGKSIDLHVLGMIRFDIDDSNVGVPVDVVDINTSSPEFVNEIQKDWKVWKS